jgi:hypothetical protein
MMTRHEGLQRLQKISSNGLRILQHLEVSPRTTANETELRLLAAALKTEFHEEYERPLPESAQKGMTLFELTVYSPDRGGLGTDRHQQIEARWDDQ